jgi:hypothetical protein
MVQNTVNNVGGGVYTVRVQVIDQNGALVSEATSQPTPVADPGPLIPQVQVPIVRVVEAGQGGRKAM